MFSFAGTMAIVLDNMDIHGWTAILIGSLIQGICMVLFPAIAQPFTRKILGTDDVAFGFWGSSLIVFTGWIARKRIEMKRKIPGKKYMYRRSLIS